MKQLVVLMIVIFTLIGCVNMDRTTNAENEGGKQSQEELNTKNPHPNGDQIDISDYYSSELLIDMVDDGHKITWKTGSVIFSAEKLEAEGEEKAESNTIINSMIVEKGDKLYTIELDKMPSSISSLALSASDEYLAVSVFYNNVGSKVIIINLINGEQNMLNDDLQSANDENIETIHTYSWSPLGNKLAFSFGDTNASKLGIYDWDTKVLLNIPTEINYITTAFVLWTKDGNNLDFISEQPSDQFKLYRYRLDSDHIEEIMDVKPEELSRFSKLGPSHF
jgi:hypothetical protein